MTESICKNCNATITDVDPVNYCDQKCQRQAAIKSVEMLARIDQAEKLEKLLEGTL